MNRQQQDDSWIPDDFKAAMEDAQQGRLVDMEIAVTQPPPVSPDGSAT